MPFLSPVPPTEGIPALPRRNREYRSEERGRVMLESLEKEKKKLLESLEAVSPVCPPRSLDRVFAEEGKKNKR